MKIPVRLAAVLTFTTTLPLLAQNAPNPGEPPAAPPPTEGARPPGGGFPGGGGMRGMPGMMGGEERKLVKQFDKDGDKQLDAAERAEAREFLKKNPAGGGFGG